jgi:hypothetical protein
MRWLLIICLFMVSALSGLAQPAFRTIVPKDPVVVGDAFQVQFIVEDNPVETFRPPPFTQFRLVSGPAYYKGSADGVKPLVNVVYTLEAIRPGRFVIPGGTIIAGGTKLRSNNAEIRVLSVEEAAGKKEAANEYFLRPGENPQQKIRENLFVKVQVNKRSCFVGEPIQATFKLYSRLQSRSDIVKNPGFYGFTVFDQVNLSDKESTVENIGGKLFDVHTVRRVQLFPLQSGILYIDEMEVRNRVEFSRNAVSKKTEQEIAEGMSVFEEQNEMLTAGSEVFESEMKTESVAITVKPLPETLRPATFNGAVGEFKVETYLDDNFLVLENKGVFLLKIKGAGNFMQIDAPQLKWPQGVEVFEPRVSDHLERASYPLEGERVFQYPFVVSEKGEFIIPAFHFHYFNPDSGKYRHAVTAPTTFTVSRKALVQPGDYKSQGKSSGYILWIIMGLAAVFIPVFLFLRRKNQPGANPRPETYDSGLLESVWKSAPSADEPAAGFYRQLSKAIWKFFTLRIPVPLMKKQSLIELLNSKSVDPLLIEELEEILLTCEVSLFGNLDMKIDKAGLLQRSRELLEKIDRLL